MQHNAHTGSKEVHHRFSPGGMPSCACACCRHSIQRQAMTVAVWERPGTASGCRHWRQRGLRLGKRRACHAELPGLQLTVVAAAVIAAVTLTPAYASASGSASSSGSGASSDDYSSAGVGWQWPHPTLSQPDFYSDVQGMEFFGFYDHGEC